MALPDIGYASAALSAMQLLATVGVLGLGTLIIGEVARAQDPAALVGTASLLAAAGSAGLAPLKVVPAPCSPPPHQGSSKGASGLFARRGRR